MESKEPWGKEWKATPLGRGSYGEVTLITNPKGKQLVVKKLEIPKLKGMEKLMLKRRGKTEKDYRSDQLDTILKEIDILKLIRHVCGDYLLCIEGYKIIRGDVYIYMPYIPGSYQLMSFMMKNNPTLLQKLLIMHSLALGMSIMHDRGIVHLDVKLGNVLIVPRELKIYYIDFGLACLNPHESFAPYMKARIEKVTPLVKFRKSMQNCIENSGKGGTPTAVSPQRVQGKIKTFEQAKQDDIWALGIMYYQILVGRPHFIDMESFPRFLAQLINLRDVDLTQEIRRVPIVKDVVAPLLRVDASQRPNIRQVLAILNKTIHSLVKDKNFIQIREEAIRTMKVNKKTDYVSPAPSGSILTRSLST